MGCRRAARSLHSRLTGPRLPPAVAFDYPQPRRSDQVDDYHGITVADPYRWMEDPHDPETRGFVAAENAVTEPYLAGLREVPAMRRRIGELWDTPRTGAPRHRNGVTVWEHNDGLQNQPVLHISRDGGDPEVLLDPNEFTADGTVAVTVWSLSPDGRHLAFSTSDAGSDRQIGHVLETSTGNHLPDELRHLRFTSFAWVGDGFFYTRFPEQAEKDVGLFVDPRVCYHRIGTDQADDELIFSNPAAPALGYDAVVTDDEQYVVLTEWEGTSRENGLLYRPLDGSGEFMRIVERGVATHDFLGHDDERFFVLTDLDAPNGAIVTIPLDDLRARTVIVGEGDVPIDFAGMAADRLIAASIEDASHQLDLFDLDGTPAGRIELPGLGTAAEVTGRESDPTIFIGFQSFLHPPMALRWEGGVTTVFAGESPPLDPDHVVVERRYVGSTDGDEVGMFVVRLKNTDLPAPTELYGYGGFNINLTPTYNPARLAWLEAGGVVAVANLRGGSEKGEEWHRQGMLGNKQQVFDDFIACAEQLIEDGITTQHRLGIRGGSNGGLLTTAVMLQQPNLFGAVVAQVPVTDMYRYQHFTAGRYWTVEYGDGAADAEAFAWLSTYSPLHNVEPGIDYPPLLVLTAETDDRVVPMHSLKFIAEMHHAAGGSSERPLLVRVETRAGHGLGKPTSKVIDEMADVYGFLLHHLE